MEGDGTAGEISRLPKDCIAHILSLTTPIDACRSATAASLFRSALETDAVWEAFLPTDYQSVLARATEPVEFRSKKDLYFRLCRPLLIDDGRKSFSLDKSTGRNCCMLSARDLRIVWGETPQHWLWVFLPGTRFSEGAKLLDVWWFHISAKLSVSMLTPETTYVVYLVYRQTRFVQGFSSPPPEATITVGPFTSKQVIRLASTDGFTDLPLRFYERRSAAGPHPQPPAAADEVVLGEFFVGEGCDGEVEIVLSETSGVWKTGLIVEGIEFRPKN